MKKMTALLALFISISIVVTSLGLGSPLKSDDDATMRKLLEKTEARYQNTKAFQADFIQYIYSPGMSQPMNEATGLFYFAEPCLMKWEYKTPEAQSLTIFPGLGWLFSSEDNQVQLFDTGDFYNSVVARAFLKGLLKAFDIVYWSKSQEQQAVTFTMKPKEKDSSIKQIELVVDENQNLISKIVVEDLGDTKNAIIFTNQRWLDKAEPDLFLPNMPKNTLIIDDQGNNISYDDLLKIYNERKGDRNCYHERKGK